MISFILKLQNRQVYRDTVKITEMFTLLFCLFLCLLLSYSVCFCIHLFLREVHEHKSSKIFDIGKFFWCFFCLPRGVELIENGSKFLVVTICPSLKKRGTPKPSCWRCPLPNYLRLRDIFWWWTRYCVLKLC